MSDVEQEQVIPYLEERLSTLGVAVPRLREIEIDIERRTKDIVDEYVKEVDELTTRRDAAVEEITAVFSEHQQYLTDGRGKTVTLRGGTLSARTAPEKLEIPNEAMLEAELRRSHKWLKHSTQPKRKLDKSLLKANVTLLKQLPVGLVRLVKEENLTIKLPKLQVEIKRSFNPLRSPLKKH